MSRMGRCSTVEESMEPDTEDSVQRRILIVEDEPDNREIMRTIAEDMLGLEAMLAADGETAIRLATSMQPVVILMDLMMPVLDGFEAIQRLKNDPSTAHIPVIAVTALSRPTDRQRALDFGADDYLSKPFDLDMLITTLSRYTDLPQAAEDSEQVS